MVGVGVAHDDAIERVHTPTSKEVHHVRTFLRPAGVQQVVLAAGLHQHPVTLAHVYEAYGERTRRGRRGAAEGALCGNESAGWGEEEDHDHHKRH